MIPATEFNDVIAIGDAARQTDGAHGGFGATGDEADFFEPRDGAIDERSELDFEFVGDAIAGAALSLIGDGPGDLWIGVAEEHGAPGADVVEVFVAIDID